MAKKSKLLLALDAHKGRDYSAEKKRKELKAGEKRKRQREEARKVEANGENEDSDIDDDHEVYGKSEAEKAVPQKVNGILKSNNSISAHKLSEDENSEDEEEEKENTTIPQPPQPVDASASEAEQESDVPLSDLDVEDLEDTIPHQRLTINNGPALLASTKRVAVVKPQMPFHHHNSLISTLPDLSTTIQDPNDDLTRELEFYRIAKEATMTARSLLKKEKIPFTRPTDYFAEMVKSDEHMGKVKKKMYDEAAGKKASEEAKKLRDAKKFGKQVQMAKEQERAREKRDTLDKIKELKRSKKEPPSPTLPQSPPPSKHNSSTSQTTLTESPKNLTNPLLYLANVERKGQPQESVNEGDDLFQEISVEDPTSSTNTSRTTRRGTQPDRPNVKRQKRDARFGHGGKKRFSKSGDAISSSDLTGFSVARMKGRTGAGGRAGGRAGAGAGARTTKRLGKSRRAPGRA